MMVSNATMGKIVDQFEKIIDRQAKEIDDLRNRLAAHTYTEYAIAKQSEKSTEGDYGYTRVSTPEVGTIGPLDDFPQR